jgi:NDP-sugar pyrophosphorylase family protein
MVAGMSSRFGGKIKQFAKVGLNGETLIEVSITQAKKAGFDKIIFIVGEKTKAPFKEKFGNKYLDLPVFYAEQSFDKKVRDKPWGTVDALISAEEVIKENFIVLNGDDLYGENALKKAVDFLKESKEDEAITIGYKLGSVIPEKGSTNRGIFEIDEESYVKSISEVFDIEKDKLDEKELSEESLASMNLFGLSKESIFLLKEKLNEFKEINKGDRKAECLLPVELGKLIKENKIKMKLKSTNDKWFGVTNPEDEEVVAKELKQYYKKDFYEC